VPEELNCGLIIEKLEGWVVTEISLLIKYLGVPFS